MLRQCCSVLWSDVALTLERKIFLECWHCCIVCFLQLLDVCCFLGDWLTWNFVNFETLQDFWSFWFDNWISEYWYLQFYTAHCTGLLSTQCTVSQVRADAFTSAGRPRSWTVRSLYNERTSRFKIRCITEKKAMQCVHTRANSEKVLRHLNVKESVNNMLCYKM